MAANRSPLIAKMSAENNIPDAFTMKLGWSLLLYSIVVFFQLGLLLLLPFSRDVPERQAHCVRM